MELFPAIDLIGGRCVRLRLGDFAQQTTYDTDPVEVAGEFVEAGARWVHVVDLDGARDGARKNLEVVEAICRRVSGRAEVQSGGGLRSARDIHAVLDAGVSRVVLGTVIYEDPALFELACRKHRVAVGLDVMGREVAIRGWQQGSGQSLLEAVERVESLGAEAVVATQILRDGTLEGPDTELLQELLGATAMQVVASGGVGSIDDIETLVGLEVSGRGLAGAIVGKALHDQRISIVDALRAVRSS